MIGRDFYISYNEETNIKGETIMNMKGLNGRGNKNDTELSKAIYNLLIVALSLASFALFGYMGILITIFVAFYFFK